MKSEQDRFLMRKNSMWNDIKEGVCFSETKQKPEWLQHCRFCGRMRKKKFEGRHET